MGNIKIKYGKQELIKGLIISLSAVVFCLVMFFITKFITGSQMLNNNKKQNTVCIGILNYCIPSIKVNSYSFDAKKNDIDFNEILFYVMGLDVNKPSTIISKEILCLNYSKIIDIQDGEYNKTIDTFKVNDSDITKNSTAKSTDTQDSSADTSTQDGKLPNHVVTTYNPSLKKKLNTANPEVFIYHTHTTESYKDTNTENMDPTKNVCAVGDELKSELENNYGISVIHDKTIHDAYAYTSSYTRSGATLDKYLKQYKDFKLIIDMHRDSVQDWQYETIKLNNVNTAKFKFVMDKKNSHFSKNNAVAQSLCNISNNLFNGLNNPIYYYDGGNSYFNQNKSNNAVLIEVGSNINTVAEAKNTSKYVARIIAEYLKSK